MAPTAHKKRIPIENRGKVVALRDMGLSCREVAARVGCSVGAVSEIMKKYQETGTVVDKPISGRKRVTTQRQDRIMTRISLADRRKTALQISACLKEHHNFAVSVSTVQRRLREVGLKAYRARKKPRLTLTHRQKRLQFAVKHRYWTAAEWSKVVFSDESRFLLYRNDGRPFVRRRPGEAYRPDCVQPTLKHGGGGVMVWGCMSESGVGELVLVTGRLCASDYISLLRKALPASVHILGLEDDYIFQQDNASCHTAKSTKSWMARNSIRLLDWPAQSPDLNPIEHLWDGLGRQLGSRAFSNNNQLWQHLQEQWKLLSRLYISKLVESMPRRIQAVIDARGGYTRY